MFDLPAQASFESQRHFVANASHELRTPLAGQRALLQVALADPDASADDLRAACKEALQLGDQQERFIDALLTLASSERGLERRKSVELGGITEWVLLGRKREAERRGIHIDASIGAASVEGDPRLIESLVANLVDNALCHNVRGGTIEIATISAPGKASIAVTNTGPGGTTIRDGATPPTVPTGRQRACPTDRWTRPRICHRPGDCSRSWRDAHRASSGRRRTLTSR
jgi:signal transduction histidine kinase